MSRIGKKPIPIKDVTVTKDGNLLKVKGKLGELQMEIHPNINVEVTKEEIIVTRPNDEKQNRALHGLTRSLINNMVVGVTEGFSKTLDIVGVGYRAEAKGNGVLLTIGYSHPIFFIPPEGIKVEVVTPNQLKISGSDKELVGLVAAKIRSFRKPEPYKGKGIKYSNEVIIRKAGKTAGK
ncbi:Ribosomal protein L6 [Melioribacter roseus P3M-2]|uniref:Large ribosomal subunit protein uL6 n=1 Tax=Melioribacter roseus (strain DSM 23840 / JCM 17771 / VKM B-2668 / P3M-2) TaxID=1191523 RepID=I6Z2U5_MELRP|nr:50S ribosomal protein L6 [Melioribacter roseus]AFN73445.1 Ribosomal protein L6 [Melioribacter roseus P3M-2]